MPAALAGMDVNGLVPNYVVGATGVSKVLGTSGLRVCRGRGQCHVARLDDAITTAQQSVSTCEPHRRRHFKLSVGFSASRKRGYHSLTHTFLPGGEGCSLGLAASVVNAACLGNAEEVTSTRTSSPTRLTRLIWAPPLPSRLTSESTGASPSLVGSVF